jgi:hypothetical protein
VQAITAQLELMLLTHDQCQCLIVCLVQPVHTVCKVLDLLLVLQVRTVPLVLKRPPNTLVNRVTIPLLPASRMPLSVYIAA